MAVQMELSRIRILDMTDMQVIVLSEIEGGRTFPIVIGDAEARAIERGLRGIELPRPLTHDLLGSVIEELGGRLEEIVINDLHEGTFFAKLVIQVDGKRFDVDSRPSDAIALGVAQDVPIYVADHVLEHIERDGMQTPGGEIDEDEEGGASGTDLDWD